MAARPDQAPPSMEVFDAYFRRADLDMDGRISGAEAVAFFQGSNLPKHILAQIWMYSDANKTGFLGRPGFYNALRLVTVAQSGRELTPDIVKAALEGPAAAKIPAPQINPVASPATPVNPMTTPRPLLNSLMASSPQISTMSSTSPQYPSFRGPQVLPNAGVNQQFSPTSVNQVMRPLQTPPAVSSRPTLGVNQGLPGGGMVSGPHLPNSSMPNLSTDWLTGRTSGASVGGTSQVSNRGATSAVNQAGFVPAQSGPAASVIPRQQAPSTAASSVTSKLIDPLSSFQPAQDSKALVVSGNGFSSDSFFGSDVFSATPQSKQDASLPNFSASSMPSTFNIVSAATGPQLSVRPIQNDLLQSSSTMPPIGSQLQRAQSLVKQNQAEITQSSSSLSLSVVSVGATSSASNQPERQWPKMTLSDIQKYSKVFLEVDKDKDGKITGEQARELFLSWKLPREILKKVWDLSDQDNDSMLSLREFITALYLMERYREGYPLPAELPNSVRFDEILLRATGQTSVPFSGPAWQPSPGFSQQGIPGMHHTSPMAGFQSQTQARIPPPTDGPVQPVQQKPSVPVLEKYLVNQLSKEEQSTLNSKFQESTDADKKVQELEKEILDSKEKIEFYRTKMQELVLYKSRCDNRLNEITEKASADKREVESLQKKYEEKYKQVGDVASTLTVEEATFRDVQERKLELYNAIVKMEQGGSADGLLQVRADRIQSDLEELVKALNERCKRYELRVKPTALIELPFGWQPGIQEGSTDWDEDWDKFEDEGFMIAKELTVDVENIIAAPKSKSPSSWSDKASLNEVSPVVSSSNIDKKMEKPSSNSEPVGENDTTYAQSEDGSMRSPPGSPPAKSSLESPSQESHSVHFGMHDASPRAKESQSDHGGAESTNSGDKFVDETSWGATFDTNDDVDSIWGFNHISTKESDRERNKQNSFFDSGDFGLNPIRTDSPSAASIFGKKEKSSFFADSVPGTPLFNSTSSPRFNEGPEDHSFDRFDRFDSLSMHDSGSFPQRDSLARFDSIRSTSDFSRGFASFDDRDPFGSTGPFKSSESHTPRKGSDNWSAF